MSLKNSIPDTVLDIKEMLVAGDRVIARGQSMGILAGEPQRRRGAPGAPLRLFGATVSSHGAPSFVTDYSKALNLDFCFGYGKC
jgi:hypothetical protein